MREMAESPLAGKPPSKIIAVRGGYRSRAMEHGTVPPWPSYVLKPPSTLASSGDPVRRPPGCELLAFEGEVALVIGRRTARVAARRAWDHVGWVTAANDFGVHDLSHADGGADVRARGVDGYTPLGPRFLRARTVDPDDVRVRTWVNGDVAQDATSGEDLLFSFSDIVADISRLTTLERGDVILTGTPAGSTVVTPGDVVEVEVTASGRSTGRLLSPVANARYGLRAPGAMPRADDAARAAAFGANPGNAERLFADSPAAVLAAVGSVSAATLAAQLRRRGYDSVTLDRLRAANPELKMAGFARTVRYVPLREDLLRARGGLDAQQQAVEQIRPGEILVIEARGDITAGTIGDILALRAQVRGAAGIVTDGAIRDSRALRETGIPVYHGGSHPAAAGRRHVPWEANVTVACAGVTVQPGDILAGDADGVVVVPRGIAGEVAADAAEQERQEEFIADRVTAGESVEGLYPLGPRWRPAYRAWLAERP